MIRKKVTGWISCCVKPVRQIVYFIHVCKIDTKLSTKKIQKFWKKLKLYTAIIVPGI